MWRKNSRCKLSAPGALPALSDLIAAIISSSVNCSHKSWSAEGEFHSSFSCQLTCLVNCSFGFFDFPLFSRHDATALGLIEFGFRETFLQTVSLLIVDHAFQLDHFILILSTVDIHCSFHLAFRWSIRRFVTTTFPSTDCAFSCWEASSLHLESHLGM